MQEFRSDIYFGVATTLFTHDYGCDEKVESIIYERFKDAYEFKFRYDTTAGCMYLQRILNGITKLLNEKSEK